MIIMGIENILQLIGGLALFLYGMQMTSSGMEEAAGNKMKDILQKLTSTWWSAVTMGAAITCLLQSSSASTVMVVGFVNSKMMTLQQAVWIIMGANIGTTITGQLVALDMGMLAPIFAIVGVGIVMFMKKPKARPIGTFIAGIGILFIGMDMMSGAMVPLRDSPEFVEIVTTFSNPLVGILVGAGFTAIIQSSAASIGIMQALANNGVVTLGNAVYVLFGQNIGTCVTAVLAAIGAKRNAKRTTVVHLLFNVIGTVLFTLFCMATPILLEIVESLTPTNPSAQIANMHTIFNVLTSFLLLPFSGWLVKAAMTILPEKEEEINDAMHLKYLQPLVPGQERKFGSSEIYLNELQKEMMRMLRMTKDNLIDCYDVLLENDFEKLEVVAQKEEYIDFLKKEITNSITYYIPFESNPENTRTISTYFNICQDVERIGDHALNIAENVSRMSSDKIVFSENAKVEIFAMKKACVEIMNAFFEGLDESELKISVQKLEDIIDEMTREFSDASLKRMRAGECQRGASVVYAEILVDFERIGDYALNVAQALKIL